jgi:hypothetical protein
MRMFYDRYAGQSSDMTLLGMAGAAVSRACASIQSAHHPITTRRLLKELRCSLDRRARSRRSPAPCHDPAWP